MAGRVSGPGLGRLAGILWSAQAGGSRSWAGWAAPGASVQNVRLEGRQVVVGQVGDVRPPGRPRPQLGGSPPPPLKPARGGGPRRAGRAPDSRSTPGGKGCPRSAGFLSP